MKSGNSGSIVEGGDRYDCVCVCVLFFMIITEILSSGWSEIDNIIVI